MDTEMGELGQGDKMPKYNEDIPIGTENEWEKEEEHKSGTVNGKREEQQGGEQGKEERSRGKENLSYTEALRGGRSRTESPEMEEQAEGVSQEGIGGITKKEQGDIPAHLLVYHKRMIAGEKGEQVACVVSITEEGEITATPDPEVEKGYDEFLEWRANAIIFTGAAVDMPKFSKEQWIRQYEATLKNPAPNEAFPELGKSQGTRKAGGEEGGDKARGKKEEGSKGVIKWFGKAMAMYIAPCTWIAKFMRAAEKDAILDAKKTSHPVLLRKWQVKQEGQRKSFKGEEAREKREWFMFTQVPEKFVLYSGKIANEIAEKWKGKILEEFLPEADTADQRMANIRYEYDFPKGGKPLPETMQFAGSQIRIVTALTPRCMLCKQFGHEKGACRFLPESQRAQRGQAETNKAEGNGAGRVREKGKEQMGFRNEERKEGGWTRVRGRWEGRTEWKEKEWRGEGEKSKEGKAFGGEEGGRREERRGRGVDQGQEKGAKGQEIGAAWKSLWERREKWNGFNTFQVRESKERGGTAPTSPRERGTEKEKQRTYLSEGEKSIPKEKDGEGGHSEKEKVRREVKECWNIHTNRYFALGGEEEEETEWSGEEEEDDRDKGLTPLTRRGRKGIPKLQRVKASNPQTKGEGKAEVNTKEEKEIRGSICNKEGERQDKREYNEEEREYSKKLKSREGLEEMEAKGKGREERKEQGVEEVEKGGEEGKDTEARKERS
jgi:hypothetical protein